MTIHLARPSFWTEPRDPWAWQRALRRVAELGHIEDPWPAWEGALRDLLPRRAVPGLYGLKTSPAPGVWLGAGLLVAVEGGWTLAPDAVPLAETDREAFQVELARWLVERSPWVRLALSRLAAGSWRLSRGVAPLLASRALRVGDDLEAPPGTLGDELPATLTGVGMALRPPDDARALAPLHAPLYLLHAIGWLDGKGLPTLPADLQRSLLPESPAALLRRVTFDEGDAGGFVPLDRAARRLWALAYEQPAPRELGAWIDRIFGLAIERGTIEVHAWAPGQPRHGRGLHGDRDRKLVRWTIHDDFVLPGAPR